MEISGNLLNVHSAAVLIALQKGKISTAKAEKKNIKQLPSVLALLAHQMSHRTTKNSAFYANDIKCVPKNFTTFIFQLGFTVHFHYLI